jgi:RNase adapter protein RapZ
MNDEANSNKGFPLILFSFGFKYGVPDDANLIFDGRFLPNPYWVDELRPYTGLDEQVAEFVVGSREGREFMELLVPLLRFLIEKNRLAQKKGLRCAVGCTGGHHRSVAVVEALKHALAGEQVALQVFHRDLTRE